MNGTAKDTAGEVRLDWTPSVYFAQSTVEAPLTQAWEFLLDYRAWNPSFAGADVVRVRGEPNTPNERVLISKPLLDASGDPLPEFYAETVKVVPPRRVIWYVYPVSGDSFRNFVDFGLTEVPGGVRFDINYYAQSPRRGELSPEQEAELNKMRAQSEADLCNLAISFRNYSHGQLTR